MPRAMRRGWAGLSATPCRVATWDQWAQTGVLASTQRHDRWAADPEALMLLTFEVGRD